MSDHYAEMKAFLSSLSSCTPDEMVRRCNARAAELNAAADAYDAEGLDELSGITREIALRMAGLAIVVGSTPETHPDLWEVAPDPDAELAAMTGGAK